MESKLYNGDCLDVLKTLPDESIDSLVTDPPYHLSNVKPLDQRIEKVFGSFNDIVFPNFNKGDIQVRKYSELLSVLIKSSSLRRFEGVGGIESWIGVPEGAVDFNSDIKVRQIKIKTCAEPSSLGVSNGKLGDETDIKNSEFVGDFILDFGNSIEFPGSDLKRGNFGKFLFGFFTMPISSISLPGCPSFESGQGFLGGSPDFVEHIRLRNYSFGQPKTTPFVLTDWRTKNGLMLRFDVRGRSAKLIVADGTSQCNLFIEGSGPKLVRTFSGTGCLSSMFKSITVSFIIDTTFGASHFYFHLWVPFTFNISEMHKIVKGFMGNEWDTLPSVEIWKECFRVLKPGAFGFIMSSPRQDVLSRMILNLEDAGFETHFTSIFWSYATGFPKAMNIGKMVDKRPNRLLAEQLRNKLNDYRIKAGFTIKQLNEHFGFATTGSGLVHHWMLHQTQPTVPTKKQYVELKKLLNIDDLLDEVYYEAEREVTGKDKQWGKEGSTPLGKYGEFLRKDIPISDQAKQLKWFLCRV